MSRLLKLIENFPKEVDACIIQSSINRRYFLNFTSSAGTLIITKDKSYFIIDFRYFEKAKKNIKYCEVLMQDNIYYQMNEIFKKHGVKNIAIESYNMTIHTFEKIKRELSNYTILSGDEINNSINILRSQKDDDEINYIKKAQSIAEKAYNNILNYFKPGVTEKQIALELEFLLKKEGGEGLSFPIICAFGENGSHPHAVPTDRELKDGDLCTLDFGTIYNGYCSDMTRTFGYGNVDDDKKEIYNIVLEAQLLAIDSIKCGKKCKDIDSYAREYICKKGYGDFFGHGLGHSIGLDVHESPYFNKLDDTLLLNNTIMTVEPGIYIPGKYGVRIEDMIIVKECGCDIITKCEKNLIIL